MSRVNILFLCTGNSCRSQMAEGWARSLHPENKFAFYSAGIKKSQLNPHAVTVMAEAGIDISGQTSKNTEDIANISMNYIFTVCGHAHETCPFFPGGKTIHVGFDDPPHLTESLPDGEEKLKVYRRVKRRN
ncbi:MAG: arsenate reductase ArsC [Bdellovibrionales bacterium]